MFHIVAEAICKIHFPLSRFEMANRNANENGEQLLPFRGAVCSQFGGGTSKNGFLHPPNPNFRIVYLRYLMFERSRVEQRVESATDVFVITVERRSRF